jgi:glucose dehydrogenase
METRGGAAAGTIWGWFTFDPDLNLFYYGTSNCSPWNPDYRRKWGEVDLDARGGLTGYRNNYCSSILARDADSGELVWAYNLTPQDAWDLDEPSAGIVVDLQIGGRMRKTLVHPARNGFYYVFDRATGEMLLKPWAFVYNDLIKGVDMETGRALYDVSKIMFTKLEDRKKYVPDAKDTAITWCPGIAARNWFQDAYSPRTGLIYTPTQNTCSAQKMIEGRFVPGADYTLRETVGDGTPILAPGAQGAGDLQAIDPVTGKVAWRVPWKISNNTPVMATAGDLLFQAVRMKVWSAHSMPAPDRSSGRSEQAATSAAPDQLRRTGRPAICGDHREPTGPETVVFRLRRPETRISAIAAQAQPFTYSRYPAALPETQNKDTG